MTLHRTIALFGLLSWLFAGAITPALTTSAEWSEAGLAELERWRGALKGAPGLSNLQERAVIEIAQRAGLALVDRPVRYIEGPGLFRHRETVDRAWGVKPGGAVTKAPVDNAGGLSIENSRRHLYDHTEYIATVARRIAKEPYFRSLRRQLVLVLMRAGGMTVECIVLLPLALVLLCDARLTRAARRESLITPNPWVWAAGEVFLHTGFWVTGLMMLIPLVSSGILFTLAPPLALFTLWLMAIHTYELN